MKFALSRWLAAFIATMAACAFSIAFLDRHIVHFFGHYIGHSDRLENLLHAVLVIIPVTGFCLLWSSINLLRHRPVPRLVGTYGIAGFSVLSSLAFNELILKPAFSRYDVNDYLADPHQYGFRWLGGVITSSFPSGHTVTLMSFLSVLWLLSPRWRPAYCAIAALVMLDLAASGWHFFSDIAAGSFVGIAAGFISVTLLGKHINNLGYLSLKRWCGNVE